MLWKYETDQNPKKKHAWSQDVAGFVVVRGVKIGKCPKGISAQQAERLLNSGIVWNPPDWTNRWPHRIYVVHAGVVYAAVPTNPGVSYHAFPEQGRRLRELPDLILEKIKQAAKQLGCEDEVRRWMSS